MRWVIVQGLWRVEAFLRDLRRGLLHGYPVCCIFQFALGTLLELEPQAVRRGIIKADGEYWVPCRYHQWRRINWYPCEPPYLSNHSNRGVLYATGSAHA